MSKSKYFLLVIILVLLIFLAYLIIFKKNNQPLVIDPNKQVVVDSTKSSLSLNKSVAPENKFIIAEPVSLAQLRVTKKYFGTKVSPQDSPVSPERFSGYHTGVDFETRAEEAEIDIPIYAICPGTLLLKKWANGYGGVVVQSCPINKEDVTVVYGHLNLASVRKKIGETMESGQRLGLLGQGYSSETDGARKHLHLGIHRGKDFNLRGYVSSSKDLGQWIDVLTLLP